MRRVLFVAAIGVLLAAGCTAKRAEAPPPPPPPPVANWPWQYPGSVVLRIEAVDAGLVALASGYEAGLAPGMRMGLYRDNLTLKIGTLQLIKVERDATVGRLIGAIDEVRIGDTAVYLPTRSGS